MDKPEVVVKEPTLKERHSLGIRIWHWSTYLVMTGSLGTVLLAKTIFNTGNNINLVQETLQKGNVSATQQLAKSVSHEFNDILWHWHTYIGYVLAALFGFRIILEFVHPKERKLIPLIKNGMKYLKGGGDKKETKHFLVVKYAYVLFYLALLVMVSTGLFMAYSDDIDSLKDIRHSVKELHSAVMWVILGYLVLHIGGVILAEIGTKYKGIVSDMIHGGEK
jgi:Ni/Fe-hydrogenase 1 B-type cytochrome subunit